MNYPIVLSWLMAATALHAQDGTPQTFVRHGRSEAILMTSRGLLDESGLGVTKGNSSASACPTVSPPEQGGTARRAVVWKHQTVLTVRVPNNYTFSESAIEDSQTEGRWQQSVMRVELPSLTQGPPAATGNLYLGSVEGFPQVLLPGTSIISSVSECRLGSAYLARAVASYGDRVNQTFVLAYGHIADGMWWSFAGESSTLINSTVLEDMVRAIIDR